MRLIAINRLTALIFFLICSSSWATNRIATAVKQQVNSFTLLAVKSNIHRDLSLSRSLSLALSRSISDSVPLPFSVSLFQFAVLEPVIHPQSESGWEGPGGQPYQSHRHFSNTHTLMLCLFPSTSPSLFLLSLSLSLCLSLSALPLSWFLSLSAVRGRRWKRT